MRAMICGLALLGLAVLLTSVEAGGGKKKEVKLKGTITCAKCDLGESKACHTVIQVKEGDKKITYWFATPRGKEHKEICTAAKTGTVTGTVAEKDGKKIITAKSVKFD